MIETKPINNPTTRFTPSWEKSNPSKLGPLPPPHTTSDKSKTVQYLPPHTEEKTGIEKKPGKDTNPWAGPPKQKKRILRHQVPTERKDKTIVAGCLNNNPDLTRYGAGVRHRQSPRKMGDASDFSMGQGDSVIP